MIEPSKIAPLKYIQYFLQKDTFESYEKRFFDNPINPSFKSNREEGYIYYLKDSYVNDEQPYVKTYFKDELERVLLIYINISLPLIHERKDEIENTERNANIYINRQLKILENIKMKIDYFPKYQSIIFSCLGNLEAYLNSLLVGEKEITKHANYKISNKSFFDLKPEYKIKHLKKLYEETLEIDMIDEDVVSEEDFIKVFTAPKLPLKNHSIRFNKDNRAVVYYLDTISTLFDNLIPSAIQKSQSFYNKNSKLFLEGDISQARNHFNKNDVSEKYKYIKSVLPK